VNSPLSFGKDFGFLSKQKTNERKAKIKVYSYRAVTGISSE
jgi:hypothetical protein